MNSLKQNTNNIPEDNSKCIQIRSKTWTRDSHGLFDYENNQVKTTTLLINSNGSLFRKKHEVKYNPFTETINNTEEDNEDLRELGKIHLIDNKFQLSSLLENNMPVNNQTLTDLQEKIWYVVASNTLNISIVNTNNSYLSQYKYELRKNDIIKLGRIKFLIKDMNIADGEFVTTEETFRPYQECEKIQTKEGDICRICLFNSTDDDTNPIISVCKCKGSINLIHLNCLQLWLEQKRITRETTNKPGISYTIKSFNCELCKEPYPTTIKFKDNLYHLLTYFIPEGQNFIILESLNSIKENQYPLSLHVLMFIENEDSFVLGRGHESDVRISDISVSRSHAKIIFRNKKFSLEDTGSKFGTLVLAKDSVSITKSQMILQIGRTLLSIAEIKSESVQNKKSSIEINNAKDYEYKYDFVNINNLEGNGMVLQGIDKYLLNSNELDNYDVNKINKEDKEDDGSDSEAD